MTSNSTTPCLPQSETETAVHLFDSWFDPIEAGLRDRVRDFLHAMFEGELDVLLSRPRYGRVDLRWGDSGRFRHGRPARPQCQGRYASDASSDRPGARMAEGGRLLPRERPR